MNPNVKAPECTMTVSLKPHEKALIKALAAQEQRSISHMIMARVLPRRLKTDMDLLLTLLDELKLGFDLRDADDGQTECLLRFDCNGISMIKSQREETVA